MSNQAVEVKILGNITRVNCPDGEEESLLRAAKELDTRLTDMAERTKITNEVKLLTIAALNICYELQEQQSENQSIQDRIKNKVEQLSASLEDALKKQDTAGK